MRISSMQIFNIARQSMAGVSQEMAKTQEQMSTGKRVLTPADDPVAATKILQLEDQLNSIDQYKKNIDIAQNNLALEESALEGVGNLIQRFQELTVAAGNTASLTKSEYNAIAQEVDVRLSELVNLMNTQNAGGDYIFGGYKSSGAPFVGDSFNGFEYRGDEGQQQIQVADNTFVAATDSGKKAFMAIESSEPTVRTSASPANRAQPPARIDIGQVVDKEAYAEFFPKDMVITFNPDGNLSPPGKNFTVTERTSGRVVVADQAFVPGEPIILNGVQVRISGSPASGTVAPDGSPVAGDRFFIESSDKQDLLTTVMRLKNAMQEFDGSEEGKKNVSEVVASTLNNLSNAQDAVLNVTTSIGARVNTLESTRDLHLDSELVSKEVISQLRDVDYAEAASRLSQQTLILQAAQQSFIRVSQLNLFSRL